MPDPTQNQGLLDRVEGNDGTASKPETPISQMKPYQDSFGNWWVYDQSTKRNRQVQEREMLLRGRDVGFIDPVSGQWVRTGDAPAAAPSARTAGGQLGSYDIESNTFTAAKGTPEKTATPSQEATAAKLGMDPGSIEWSGGYPIRQWGAGGTYTNIANMPEVQAGHIEAKLADLSARRAELARLSNPRFQSPGEGQAEIAAIGQQIEALDREIAALQGARQQVGRLGKEPGYGGGAQGRETPQEVYAKRMAEARAKFDELKMLEEAGYEVKPRDMEEFRASLDAAKDAKRAADALALAGEQSRLRGQEAEAAAAREAPYKEAEAARAAEGLRQSAASQRLTGAQYQAGVLGKQAEAGQFFMDQATKLGVEVSDATISMAFDPLMEARRILQQAVREGAIRPEWIPDLSPRRQNQAAPYIPTTPGAPMATPQAPTLPGGAPRLAP